MQKPLKQALASLTFDEQICKSTPSICAVTIIRRSFVTPNFFFNAAKKFRLLRDTDGNTLSGCEVFPTSNTPSGIIPSAFIYSYIT